MSTAIMHQSLYEFGELFMKNQSSTNRQNSMNHINNNGPQQQQQQISQQIQQQQSANNTNSVSMTSIHNITAAANNSFNNNSSLQQQQLTNHKQLLRCYSQEQHQQNSNQQPSSKPQQQQLTTAQLHHALARAHSTPQGSLNGSSNTAANSAQHISLVLNSLIENLGGHRRLERTQSEPAPQLLKAQAAQAALAQINTSRYKTELCRPFEEAGTCKYGDKCQFAHGMQELRNLQRHPKYKTELCRTFHTVGFCPYGPRCHFVHNAEEARNHNRAVAAYHAAQAAAQQQSQQQRPAPLSLSPTFSSMSTGSDRTSPSGSLSQSPTGSMTSFFNNAEEQLHSPAAQSLQHQHFASTRFGFAPVKADLPSPPPTIGNNSPSAPLSPRDSPLPVVVNGMLDDARLPVFNRLSSTIASFHDLVI